MPTTQWTVDWLKEVFLFGVDLTNDSGVAYPDSMFTQAMGAALAWLSNEIHVAIPKTTYTERHDFSQAEGGEFWMLHVDHRPIRTITSLELQIAGQSVFTVPADWLQPISGLSNIVQVVPSAGTLGTWSDAVYAIQTLQMSNRYNKLPGWYKIVYAGGYDSTELPYDLLDIAGKYAACYPLNIAGDLVAGAGIASKSVSLDGASQSVGTTASATNAGYGARIGQYEKDIRRNLPTLKRKYQGIGVLAV